MYKKDGLDEITEAYLNRRLYSPRITVSQDLISAITDEFRKHIKAGVNAKRVLKAIEFTAASIESTMKQDKPIGVPPKISKEDLKKSPKWVAGTELSEDDIKKAPRFKF